MKEENSIAVSEIDKSVVEESSSVSMKIPKHDLKKALFCLNSFNLEVNSNILKGVCDEFILTEPEHEGCFSLTTLSNGDDFKRF